MRDGLEKSDYTPNGEVVESEEMSIPISLFQARVTVKDQDTSDRTSVVEEK